MIGDLKLLEILFIILRVSNSGIIIHNDPAANYSSEFTRALTANLTQFCSINIDKEPSAFRDIYRIRPAVIFDFGLKINRLADLHPKEPNGSYTEIHVYKLDPIKCVESPVVQSFKNPADDLKVSLRHICMINDTHFGTEAGYILNTYPIETFRKSIDEISDNYEDQESMKRYEIIGDDFGYQECQKECVRKKMANSSSQIGLIRSCSHCHDCIVFEPVESNEEKEIYVTPWLLPILAIMICIVSCAYLHCIKKLCTFDFLDLKILIILKLPLSLAIFYQPDGLLHVCTLKAVAIIWDVNFVTLVLLKFLKFDHLPVNNFKFNKRFKIQTLPDLFFVAISVISTGLVLYYTHGESRLKPSEAYQCENKSIEFIFLIDVISTVVISSIFALKE